MSLTCAEILTSALAILDEFGLADLSMRRIATALGVQPGALYWHFDNKQSLLAALAGEVLGTLPEPGDLRGGGIAIWAGELRDRLLAHRDGAELVSAVLAMRLLDPSPVDILANALMRAGLPPTDAGAGSALVVHFVLGHSLDRQGYAQSAQLGAAGPPGPDPDEAFAYAVALLEVGLRTAFGDQGSLRQ
ncbi:TetR family transcriptional regulator [Ammonicoccus fulvus]|uniref:TetR family transcriptional regulator n=1 Tax=Ammonicoccus fulvus TaxID=3138240 RepID=A0ABZ3FRU4_9ACTN